MSSEFSFHPRILKQVRLEAEPWVIPSPQPITKPESHTPQEVVQREVEKQRQFLQQQSEALLQQARQEAEALLQQARQDAARILSEAEAKLQQMETQAYQEGLARGEKEGQAQIAKILEQFHAVLQEAYAERQRLLASTETEVVHLILEIVRKILKIEPIINEQVVVRVVRSALQQLGNTVTTKIYVHPADLELLHFHLSQLDPMDLDIVLEADEKISPGGCLIRSEAGVIDATLDSQLDTVIRSFLAVAEG